MAPVLCGTTHAVPASRRSVVSAQVLQHSFQTVWMVLALASLPHGLLLVRPQPCFLQAEKWATAALTAWPTTLELAWGQSQREEDWENTEASDGRPLQFNPLFSLLPFIARFLLLIFCPELSPVIPAREGRPRARPFHFTKGGEWAGEGEGGRLPNRAGRQCAPLGPLWGPDARCMAS